MVFDEFYGLVQKEAPEATAEQVQEVIQGREEYISENMVQAVVKRLRSNTPGGLAVSNPSTDLAPLPRPRPGSPITPSTPTRQSTLATGKPAPLTRSKLAQQREQSAPVVAQLQQRVSASQSASVGQAIGAIHQLRTQQSGLQDAVAQELALLMSPNAFMQGVMLRTGQLISEESAIDVDNLFGGVFAGANEAFAQLEPAQPYKPSNQLQEWLDGIDQESVQAAADIVAGIDE